MVFLLCVSISLCFSLFRNYMTLFSLPLVPQQLHNYTSLEHCVSISLFFSLLQILYCFHLFPGYFSSSGPSEASQIHFTRTSTPAATEHSTNYFTVQGFKREAESYSTNNTKRTRQWNYFSNTMTQRKLNIFLNVFWKGEKHRATTTQEHTRI